MDNDFISTVSHELRTPLTSIRGFSQTMLNSWDMLDDETKKKFLKIIEEQSNRLINLVENMLSVTKLQSEKENIIYKETNLKTIIEPVISVIKTAYNQLSQEYGREPTLSELTLKTGLTAEEIAVAESATAAVESIQQDNGQDGFTLESVLTDTNSEERLLEQIALRQAIAKLPEREATVIHLRYYHGLTQERISKVLSVSQVQVSRIEKKAIEHLRSYLK